MNLATKCLVAVNAHDQFTKNKEAFDSAKAKFEDILSSPNIQAACGKIDDLAKRNELDPTLTMMITKAWAATKETHLVKEDVSFIFIFFFIFCPSQRIKTFGLSGSRYDVQSVSYSS